MAEGAEFTGELTDSIAVEQARVLGRQSLVDQFGSLSTSASTLTALRKAVQRTAEDGRTLVIDQPLTVTLSDADDPIEMPSNLEMRFEGKGKITYTGFGLPLFWAKDATDITIYDARIIEDSTVATSLPSASQDFYDDVLERVSNSFPLRDIYTSFGFYGGERIRLIRPRFKAATFTWDKLLHKAITLSGGEDGTPISDVEIIEPKFDGVRWGILGFSTSGVTIRGIRSDRWAQLETTTYTWEAPGHVIYMTTLNGTNADFDLSDCVDYGTMVSGSEYEGAVSFKTLALRDFSIQNLRSKRAPGALDINGLRGMVHGVRWVGTDADAFSGTNAAKPVRVLQNSSDASVTQDVRITGIDLRLPDTNVEAITIGGSNAASADRVTLQGRIYSPSTSHAAPFVLLAGSNCHLDLDFDLSGSLSSPILARIDEGGSSNVISSRMLAGDFSTARFVEDNKATSSNNLATLVDAQSGATRRFGGGNRMETKTVTSALTCSSGATITASNLFPAGAQLRSLTTLVTTAIGTGNGTTGFQVGDGSDADRWGVRNGVGTLGGTDDSNWTVGTNTRFTSAQSVVITAVGGDFDGTGVIQVTGVYDIGVRNGDMT